MDQQDRVVDTPGGGESQMIKGLGTVIYHVRDLPRAKEWYARAFAQQPYFDQPFYVGFDINGCELGLDPDMSNVEKGNHAVAYWSVKNIGTVVEKLTGNNASVIAAITDVGDGIKVAVVQDPFGNAIGLIEEANA